jgi:hypothetical protein
MKRKLENLLQHLCPGIRFYLLWDDEPSGLRIPSLRACTSPSLHCYIRPAIEPAPVIIINRNCVRMENAERWGDGREAVEQEELALSAITLHEAAHVLNLDAPFYEEPAAPVDDETRSTLINGLIDPSFAPPIQDGSPPWGYHTPRFLRILCHLLYRAEKFLNRRLPRWAVLGAEGFCLHRIESYETSLHNECEKLTDLPLEKIPSMPIPEDFSRIVNRDLADWIRQRKENANVVSQKI